MKTISQSIKVFASLLSLLLLLLPGVRVSAQGIEPQFKPGDLDFSFGIGGKFTDAAFTVIAMAVQKDNKIVIAGFGTQTNLRRLNANGTPDMSFGNGGSTIRLLASVGAVAIQSDGKILVAGTEGVVPNINFGLARYNPDGTPDATFGNGGLVAADFFGLQDEASAIAFQADGRIVVGGRAKVSQSTTDSALACYTANGTPDFTFGMGGKLNFHLYSAPGFPDNVEFIRSLIIQPDGDIVTVGSSSNKAVVGRFLANGTPDAAFGIGGKVVSSFGNANFAACGVLQPDGRILIGGSIVKTNGSSDFMLMRLLPDGTPDADFGSNGLAFTDFDGQTDTSQQFILLNDGRILQAGMANMGVNSFTNRDFGLVCYKADGTLDPAFGFGGKVTTDFFHDYDEAYTLASQGNNRIIVGGRSFGGQNTMGVAAYLLQEPSNLDVPQIQNVTVKGKKLIVTGINFESPAELYINGEKQKKLANDEQNPTTTVIALKAGRFILPGATVSVQVKNPVTGKTSDEFSYTRPLQ